MSRPIVVVSLAIFIVYLQTIVAIDVSTTKNIDVAFDEDDVVSNTMLKGLMPDTRGAGFIGDLEIGQRYSDETVFRRVIVFDNPTNTVERTTLALSVTNGVIHYINTQNDNGSYAVICGDERTSLGSSRGSINIRVSPRTKSSLTIVIAAH